MGHALLRIVAILSAALFSAGCSTVQVSADWDPAADFSRMATWNWVPGPQPQTGDPRIDSDLADRRVRAAVESELAARGYRRALEGGADVLVAYHMGVESKVDVNTIHRTYGYGPYWAGPTVAETYVTEYEQGTLLIDILQPEDRRLVWRGSGQARVVSGLSPEERQKRVREAVRAILEQFPPPAR